ncbi:unnamed protein product, partial [Adineta steineri]
KKCSEEDDINNLTVDESAAIQLYTMESETERESFFYILNSLLRSPNRNELQPVLPYFKLLIGALEKLPTLNGVVYRGVNGNISSNFVKEIRADDPASYVTKTIEKICGHGCNLWKTRQCCHCSDKRAHKGNGLYEKYVDGIGFVNGASRNEYYCPTCKLHEDLS